MEINDLITILISSFALFFSGIATTISIVRGKDERERAIRNQITDILNQVITNDLEDAKLFHEWGKKDSGYYQNASSILNQRNACLLNQATFLRDKIPQLGISCGI